MNKGDEFPDPRLATESGLVAIGGDLSPETILKAYKKGIFPWYSEGDPILWWSPFHFIDCQVSSSHLARFGAIEIPRDRFLEELSAYIL